MPTGPQAEILMDNGSLWNARILAGKVATFGNPGRVFFTQLMQKFQAFQIFIDSQSGYSMLGAPLPEDAGVAFVSGMSSRNSRTSHCP
jgi:hypothetical protein